MVNVGDKPILHDLMRMYAHYGHKDFILCLGYKGKKFKEKGDDFNGKKILNWEAKYDLDSGLKETVKWHKTHFSK